ncbi:MAG: polysaccharide deacetylase family protein [Acidobacteria bacterium]|nr:polysaccharide deacetylase family protein [Acidobacteriota bacterium]
MTVDNWPFQEVRIPFRERKAKVKWPNDAKLAVRVYITTEWNSGPQVSGEGVYYKPDLYVISRDSQYTFTVGVYRALEIVEKYGIKISSFPNSSVVAAYPELHREIHRLGHEITARSWDHAFSPPKLRPEQLEGELRRATDTIAQVIGERPVGWISPGGRCSDKSPEILANLGYLWVGDLDGDDIPYGLKFGNKTIVAIPHRQMTTNDLHIFLRETGEAVRDVESAFEFFQRTFNHYYETATTEAPNMLMYGIHPYWSCWPDRIAFHDRALRYMKGFKDVWFCRHRDLAQWWKENYLS